MTPSILQEFDRSGIRWALVNPVPDWSRITSDIDLLLDSRDIPLAEQALGRMSFARVPLPGFDRHHHYLRYEPEHDRWIWLDIATELRFGLYGCLRIPAESSCLEMSPANMFWIQLLRSTLDRHDTNARLQALFPASSEDDDVAVVIRAVCPEIDTAELRRYVACSDWAALEAAGRIASGRVNRRGRRWILRCRCALPAKLIARFRLRGVAIGIRGPTDIARHTAEAVGHSAGPPLRTLAHGGPLLTTIEPPCRLRDCLRSRWKIFRGALVIWILPVGWNLPWWMERLAGIAAIVPAEEGSRTAVNALWTVYARRWLS